MYKSLICCKVSPLVQPITLAGTYFRNRIFASPTGYMDSNRFGEVPTEAIAYYERKAKGGAASVCIGDLTVDSKLGRIAKDVPIDDPYNFVMFNRITNAVKMQGANCSAELCHAGLYAARSSGITGEASRGLAYGPVEDVVDG